MASERRGWFDRLVGRRGDAPKIPDGQRVYAVGDIHGRDDLLASLLSTIRAHAAMDSGQNCLVFLGDYVDRGPASRAVLERLAGLDLKGWECVFLRGNHDQAVLDFLDDPGVYRVWRGFGAAETLLSYGVRPPRFDDETAFARTRDEFVEACPPRHIEFLRNLRYFYQCGDYVFVHAGLRPGVALDRQSPEDMMWIRDDFLASDRDHGSVVVHGHTPAPAPVRRFNRIGIDTGAYATGLLTAVILEGAQCAFLTADTESHLGKKIAI